MKGVNHMDIITLLTTEGVKLEQLKRTMLASPTKNNKSAYVDKIKYIIAEAGKNKNRVDDILTVMVIDKFMPALKSITTQVEYDFYHDDIMRSINKTPSNVSFNNQCSVAAKNAFNDSIKTEMTQFDGDIVIISDVYDELSNVLDKAQWKTKVKRDTLVGCEIIFELRDNALNKSVGMLYTETSDVYVLYKQDLLAALGCKDIDDVLKKYMNAAGNSNLTLTSLRPNGQFQSICEIPNFIGIVKSYGINMGSGTMDYELRIDFKGVNSKTNASYDLTLTMS